MRTMKLISSLVMVLGVFFGLSAGRVLAQEHPHAEGSHKEDSTKMSGGHSHERAAAHEGSVTMTQQHHFEVVFHEDEIRVYAYTMKQEPILDLKGVSGSVLLQAKGGEKLTLKLSYVVPDSSQESTQCYLAAKHDFSSVKEGTMRASISLKGLSNPKETSVTFRESVQLHDEHAQGMEEEHEGHGGHEEGEEHEAQDSSGHH